MVMEHKLSVLVQVDLDGTSMCLGITGCLTEATQRALHPVMRRALTANPGMQVSVDLRCAEHIEIAGVDLLRSATGNGNALPAARSVHVLLPGVLPVHCLTAEPRTPDPGSRTVGTGSTARATA